MEANEPKYVGFWKRLGAAITDSLFFQLVSFLLILVLYGSAYLRYIGQQVNTLATFYQPAPSVTEIVKAANSSYNLAEGAIYFWLPVIATAFFWMVKSATPGLMAIPAQIIDVRTGKKPSNLRLILRLVASFILGYTFGLDYLWIAISKKKQAWHDLVAGTTVVYTTHSTQSGMWTKPSHKTLLQYIVVVVIALLLNYGLEFLLFNGTTQGIGPPIGIAIQSDLHEMSNPIWSEIFAIAMTVCLLLIPPLFFRFSSNWLDEWWLLSAALAFAGGLGNILERLVLGGVHNIFHVSEGLRYVCVMCGIRFGGYFWNPADLFISIGIYSSMLILLTSRFWLIWKSFRLEP